MYGDAEGAAGPLSPTERAGALRKRANRLMWRGRFQEATQLYQEATRLYQEAADAAAGLPELPRDLADRLQRHVESERRRKSRLRIAVLACVLSAVAFASTGFMPRPHSDQVKPIDLFANTGPPCNGEWSTELNRADASGDEFRIAFVQSLITIVALADNPDESTSTGRPLCNVWLLKDADKSGAPSWELATSAFRVVMHGQETIAWISTDQMRVLYNRAKALRDPDEMDDYSDEDLSTRYLIDTDKFSNLLSRMQWPFRIRVLALTVAMISILWMAFLRAIASGAARRRAVAKQFEDAVSDNASDVTIGGIRWLVHKGQFYHLLYDAGRAGIHFRGETAWDLRCDTELEKHRTRRRNLKLWSAGILVAGLTLEVISLAGLLTVVSVLSATLMFAAFTGGAWCVWREYRYQCGYQAMKGAMVLDPPPPSWGERETTKQKALGDSKWSDESEAVTAALGDGGRRLPVHDQEFEHDT